MVKQRGWQQMIKGGAFAKKTALKVGQTHLAEHLGMATLSSFLTAAC